MKKVMGSPQGQLEILAGLARAMAHPHRLALLEAVFQHESSVEQLAETTGLSVTNTSQHLQQLRRAGFVQSRRVGKQVFYREGEGPVANVLSALHNFNTWQHSEMQRVATESLYNPQRLEGVSIEALLARLEQGALLLDVRSAEDYSAGHIPGALNIPLEKLEQHLSDLPRDRDILAYCGGRFCVLSRQAVAFLRQKDFMVQRVDDGFPGWQAAGLRVESKWSS
ncbi:metalloregulator ArsR/SmtB family transcription factor [Enterobacter sp. Ap-916]|uniref:ArsR/SmtB family transcription factor n=1 Tax=Enterobacteriaceae TaxID=543 RepID=UPI00141EA662|nr:MULTISPECIES: metalloregulator ArsR/SmtB family transcription factor [unclassified Enterobacter]NIF30893.1 metalloregulator ArsR/SmtB family transcription factor [Enterobacter sp. Cy-643]NIF57057.1 metalloregulator ArsR/SmtB family transcription factor [Enterobacter sp. Ap-867]NIG29002.1 metalloregulator ArsR/SmtB family transcription factor [Enterobacter sp. Ap-916]